MQRQTVIVRRLRVRVPLIRFLPTLLLGLILKVLVKEVDDIGAEFRCAHTMTSTFGNHQCCIHSSGLSFFQKSRSDSPG